MLVEYDDGNYMAIGHDGSITFEDIWRLRRNRWGVKTLAIECLPAVSRTVNNINMRHIFRVDFNKLPQLKGWVDGFYEREDFRIEKFFANASWDDFFRCKNKIWGPEVEAVLLYTPIVSSMIRMIEIKSGILPDLLEGEIAI